MYAYLGRAQAAGGRPDGDEGHAELRELVTDPSRSPPRMLPTQLADVRLGLGIDLVGTGARAMRPVGERGEPARLIAYDRRVHALSRHAEACGNLGDLPAVLHHGQNGLVPLLHDRQLHQHGPPPCLDRGAEARTRASRTCQASAGATVNDQPDPVSRINRNSVKDQVTPFCPASPGARHSVVGPRGREPRTCGLRVWWRSAGQSTALRLSCSFASRLNRRGNRQLNWVLHYIALGQSRTNAEAKAYLARNASRASRTRKRCDASSGTCQMSSTGTC